MPSVARIRNNTQVNPTQNENTPTGGPTENSKKRKQYDSDALDDDSEDATSEPDVDSKTGGKGKGKRKTQVPKANVKRSPRKKQREMDYEASDDEESEPEPQPKMRGKGGKAKQAPKRSPRKKQKPAEEEYEDSGDDLKDGQEVVGVVVKAPTTGRVPPGQISQNTLKFLNHLKDPACNDREWFRLHEPVYRVAEQEWKDFVEALTDSLMEVDPEIPPLPPKDVIHRIYRDIRFSNDKTPYKRGFSASFSRSGRKGIFACYHVAVKPGNESIIAAGLWCPGRGEIANIRANLQRNSKRFKRVISAPDFVKFFGKASPHPKGQRQNIFGHEDELKVAPKGVPKDHKDIDILKCRSFAVTHVFTDSEVLDPNFRQTVASVARVLQPFVHILNELLTVGGGTAVESSDEDDAEDDGEGGSDAEQAPETYEALP
ncbi:hypothetical protein D9611_010814 [Ephemerocybe angulata]|uniref:Uncharacterized protein n=1 Tax=Ephemerocybe angulata TaxID=980116 RepID=A0A8H5F1I1_9AGAR|nr:hypothetical protein D9611_010814 [Tulosesus angulatus]